jgi:DNA primase
MDDRGVIPGAGVDNVGAAFELLIEALADDSDDVDRQGAEAFRERRYTEVAALLDKVKAIEGLAKAVNKLQEDWLQLQGRSSRPVDEASTGSHATPDTGSDAARIRMRVAYNNARAQATYLHGRVTLLQGSTIRKRTYESLSDSSRALRVQLQKDGTLKSADDPNLLLLTRDVAFESPSGAAQFVAGCSVSGNRDWLVDATQEPLGKHLRGGRSAVVTGSSPSMLPSPQ